MVVSTNHDDGNTINHVTTANRVAMATQFLHFLWSHIKQSDKKI